MRVCCPISSRAVRPRAVPGEYCPKCTECLQVTKQQTRQSLISADNGTSPGRGRVTHCKTARNAIPTSSTSSGFSVATDRRRRRSGAALSSEFCRDRAGLSGWNFVKMKKATMPECLNIERYSRCGTRPCRPASVGLPPYSQPCQPRLRSDRSARVSSGAL